jgi:uncharacterized membrane protein
MSDLPLHPIFVHFPIGLGSVLPLLVLVVFLGCYTRYFSKSTWILVPMFLAIIVGSGWLAMKAGEQDEERVEKIVGEEFMDAHSHAADFFWQSAAGLLVLSLAPLGMNKGRSAVQIAVLFGSLALLWPLYNVGHSGGRLVYQLGAASVHVDKYKDDKVPESAPGDGAE